jgi:hypothetical protein
MATYSAISQQAPEDDGMPPNNGSGPGRRFAQRIGGYDSVLTLTRTRKGRKEVGFVGQASWVSSVVNLVNTSTSPRPTAQTW